MGLCEELLVGCIKREDDEGDDVDDEEVEGRNSERDEEVDGRNSERDSGALD